MKATCPLCRNQNVLFYTTSKNYQSSNDIKDYTAYKCSSCNIIFQYPFPPKENFDEIYPENYYAHSAENNNIPFLSKLLKSFLQNRKRAKYFSKIKHSLFPYFDIINNSNKVLDIGCGKGIFLDVLKSQGKDTYGLEPDVNAAKILQQKGHKALQGDILTSNYDNNYFDLVTAFQVFEHVDNPSQFLHEVYKIIKPGGYLIIETPNIESHLASYKNSWINLDLPRHLTLHSPKSIKELLEKENFKTEVLVRVSPSDIKYSFFLKRNIESNFSKKLYSILLIPHTIIQYIFNAKKGSLLVAIAKKEVL